MKDPAWNLDALQQDILEWTQNPAFLEMFWTDPVATVRRMVSTKISARDYLPPLNDFGCWEGMNGALAVLNGDQAGWGRLAKSVNCWYWYLRILIHRSGSGPFRLNKLGVAYCIEVALCLAHLMANGWTSPARWLGNRLTCGFSVRRTPNGWPGTPFEPFMACLYQKWQGIPEDEWVPTGVDLEVYEPVLASLEADDKSFNAALAGVCNYHVERIGDPEELGYPEFHHPVYNVFPAEILAIQRIRAWLGRSIPPFQHRILNNPLAHPPANMPSGEDELWIGAVAKAKSLWPDFCKDV